MEEELKTYEQLMLERIEKSPLKKFQEELKTKSFVCEGIYDNPILLVTE